jgi:hypothetical protein
MARFFNILAASIGSGLVLGASIRLGEALGGKLKAGMQEPTGNRPQSLRTSPPALLSSRLDRPENKMSRAFSARAPELQPPELQSSIAGVIARMVRQQSDVDSIRQQVSKAARTLDSLGDIASHLRSDLQNELSRNLEERLAAVEARVHLRMETAHSQTLDAMVIAMENRVTPRIIRMESEIAGQTAAVSELRECALQSECSIQRLLAVLERVMSPAQTPPGQGETPQGDREAAPAGAPTRTPSSFAVFNPIS